MRTAPNTIRARLAVGALRAQAAPGPRRGIQIGPRIRVGGSVGAVGQNVKNAVTKGVTDIGHGIGAVADNKWAKLAMAAGLAATGVGAPAAAGIMGTMGAAGGALKEGGGLMPAVTGGATGAAMGAGAAKVGDLLYGGLGTIGSGSGALGGVANAAGLGSTLAGGAKSAIGDRVKALLGVGDAGAAGAGGAGGTSGGGSSLLDKLLLGGTVAAGAADEVDRRNLRNKAIDASTGSYDARAPLRTRALGLLSAPPAMDKSALFTDPGNPYDRARRARALAASTGATLATPMTTVSPAEAMRS